MGATLCVTVVSTATQNFASLMDYITLELCLHQLCCSRYTLEIVGKYSVPFWIHNSGFSGLPGTLDRD